MSEKKKISRRLLPPTTTIEANIKNFKVPQAVFEEVFTQRKDFRVFLFKEIKGFHLSGMKKSN